MGIRTRFVGDVRAGSTRNVFGRCHGVGAGLTLALTIASVGGVMDMASARPVPDRPPVPSLVRMANEASDVNRPEAAEEIERRRRLDAEIERQRAEDRARVEAERRQIQRDLDDRQERQREGLRLLEDDRLRQQR